MMLIDFSHGLEGIFGKQISRDLIGQLQG